MGRLRGVAFIAVFGVAMMSGTVVFVQLAGAVGAFEIMAFAGKGEQGNSHQQDGK